ncbi:TPR-like protein [Athelia psychrophila]|uniref:TPR-like protein n=1 Tax=Athelia psychrophila TaxID=1759441 RepID=A0A165XEZ5_9AGAM|nr:TPR-like protein [Fibularhizoctonia sp. CBS 109695]
MAVQPSLRARNGLLSVPSHLALPTSYNWHIICAIPMLTGNKRSRTTSGQADIPQRKLLKLQDDRGNVDNQTTSSANQTTNTISFSTIDPSGTVMNVAGDFHMYSTDSVTAPSSSLSAPPPPQPLAPDIWFGRGDIVSTLAEVITGHENPRIAILGSGGMGKTATALHLIRNEAVVARYGDRIFFIACDAATNADLLASRILQTLGVAAAAGENLVTAMHLALKAAPPTLLVLDNFESTWEAERDHAVTRDLLQKIAECPSSTLIITMRATIAPPGIRWTISESLPPLPAASAKEVFLAINATFCDGSADGNEVLDELLRELDHVPLAIHLLAHVSMDLSPRYVLKQWRKQRTRMLSLDRYTKDKLESVDISISLSMESLDVERNSEAIQLLGMLCLLPDGLLQWEEHLDVIEKTFPSATSDLFLLRKFTLVYTAGTKLGVLSPIRHFVLQYHPPDLQHAQCIYSIFWELVHAYAMVDFGPEFSSAVDALSPEMGNIGNLIDHAVVHDPGEIIVDIAIQTSWYLYYMTPSSHLLHKVAGLVHSVPTTMQARYWQVSAEIMYGQSEYAEATRTFMQARDLYLKSGDRAGAAQCSESLGENLRMQSEYSEAAAALKDAQAQFFQLGDRSGAARCSRSLGQILHMQSKYSEATAIFTNARAEALEIGDQLVAAQCSQSLGDNLSMQSENSEAAAVLTDARHQFLDIGDRLGATQCLKSLGEILSRQSNYSEAAAILTNARAEFLEIGERLGAAQCSRALGDNLRMQGEYSEAAAVLTDARAQFLQINDRLGEAQCTRHLGRILLAQRRYTEAETLLMHARDQFLDIGLEAQAAECSELLEECIDDGDDEESTETSS